MKTLDEVIKAFEQCKDDKCYECAYHEKVHANSCIAKLNSDALHYLKGYQEVLPEYAQMKLDAVKNEPLTWEEMKRMTGRPVWVEEYWAPMEDEAGVTEDEGDTEAYWAILTYADEKRISVVNGRVDQFLHKDIWNNHEVSHSWQAYRKER